MGEILNLNKKPIKYVVTQNQNVITNSPISNSGALVIYEGNQFDHNQPYRELWISQYFISGGYGAKSKKEQKTLSDIADNYHSNNSYLNNRIDSAFSYTNNIYNILDESKVSKGTPEEDGDDVSYNIFDFGGVPIRLNELYDKVQEIHVLYKLEIYSVQYLIKVEGINEYFTNFSEVPIGSKVKAVKVIINGNTKDSGGIDDVQIDLYNKFQNTETFSFTLKGLESNSNIPNISNKDFSLIIEKQFTNNENYLFKISNKNGIKNYIIKNVIIKTKPSNDQSIVNPLQGENITNVIDKFPSYFLASTSIYMYTGLLNNDKVLNNYTRYLVSDNLNLNISSTDKFQHISIITGSSIQLIDALYYDYQSNHIYDIIDFILTIKNSRPFYNDTEIWNVEYQINITDNNNYNSSNNPPFLHRDEDNKLYLNEGKIIFTFMLVNDIVNNKLKNPNQYWISYNNDNNIPL